MIRISVLFCSLSIDRKFQPYLANTFDHSLGYWNKKLINTALLFETLCYFLSNLQLEGWLSLTVGTYGNYIELFNL